MNKFFIITVDTEGDNLWNWKAGDPIETKNSSYIPRFQELSNKYGFKPVYLTNYEMLCDDNYCSMVNNWQKNQSCEVALHLHAWNNPPLHILEKKYSGHPYLIEYPKNIMREKFISLYNLFVNKIDCKPFSHRAGRWAMNDDYFDMLKEFDIKVDCSFTPHISWANNMGATQGGSDYTNASEMPSMVRGVMEIPVTIRKVRHMLCGNWKRKLWTLINGDVLQLRPAAYNFEQMRKLVDVVESETKTDYIEFMLHSSELMPGGSPYFQNDSEINQEFELIDKLFTYVKNLGYQGATFIDYYRHIKK